MVGMAWACGKVRILEANLSVQSGRQDQSQVCWLHGVPSSVELAVEPCAIFLVTSPEGGRVSASSSRCRCARSPAINQSRHFPHVRKVDWQIGIVPFAPRTAVKKQERVCRQSGNVTRGRETQMVYSVWCLASIRINFLVLLVRMATLFPS